MPSSYPYDVQIREISPVLLCDVDDLGTCMPSSLGRAILYTGSQCNWGVDDFCCIAYINRPVTPVTNPYGIISADCHASFDLKRPTWYNDEVSRSGIRRFV